MRTVFAAYGIDIAKHHYEILADSVSYSGKFTAIARTGVNRRETGPLTKASFEETFSMFMKGGLFGEYDGLFSVSGNILIGKQPISVPSASGPNPGHRLLAAHGRKSYHFLLNSY